MSLERKIAVEEEEEAEEPMDWESNVQLMHDLRENRAELTKGAVAYEPELSLAPDVNEA